MSKTISEKKKKLEEGEMIQLCFDDAFKIMYANDEHLEILTMLLSKLLKVDYRLLEGKIALLPLKSSNKVIGEKKCEKDVMVSVKTDKQYNIILEVNVKRNFYNSIVDRNLYYAYQIAGHKLSESQDYSEIPYTYLINFNTFFVNKERRSVFEEFYYRDEYGYILTNKMKNLNINIAECYNLWYNKNYQGKFEPFEEDLMLLCAALVVKKEEEFKKIMKMVQMKPEIMELMEGMVRQMSHDEMLVEEYTHWKNEEERINASIISEVKEKSKKEGIDIGREEGIKERNIEIVLEMIQSNVPEELICKYTKLSLSEIEDIINNKTN